MSAAAFFRPRLLDALRGSLAVVLDGSAPVWLHSEAVLVEFTQITLSVFVSMICCDVP
jgi:hypothetical protein